ncbi:peptidase M23 (plasmid) [Alkalihalobacillus hwajinpoensis]|uniref:peptidase M23 n=1 Tax=Guptibacillus hwajinpoensis TaxID=208199 RepID=UPI0018839309|nr:peptidase M23 [Pseudalkalibacillus hwajinpoensis]MBF0706731.1 peptidase M23 [Pseudalkalibacillus hwajinpoensis]
MAHSLKVMFLMLLFAGIMIMQYNLDSDRTSTRQMKNGLELAVHDAALALDNSQLSQGKVVFDQWEAVENFKASLEANLALESGAGYVYFPKESSYYQEPFYVEHLEFIDDDDGSFPQVYSNPKYDILDTLNGPSIIAVVSTKSPRYFAGEGITIRKSVVYEYYD